MEQLTYKEFYTKHTKYIIYTFVCFVLAITAYIFQAFIYINLTDSAPKGIYIRTFSALQTGDWVISHLNGDYSHLDIKGDKLLLKKIIASQGDDYEVDFSRLKINNHIYPIFNNKKLPHLVNGKHKVPKDYFLLLNDHKLSFDSRYFGPVHRDKIICKVKLVYTFK